MLRLVSHEPETQKHHGLEDDPQPLEELLQLLSMVDRLDSETFYAIEYELVDRYRNNEGEQERIAVAVTAASNRLHVSRTRERLDELLLMLMVTHDPLI